LVGFCFFVFFSSFSGFFFFFFFFQASKVFIYIALIIIMTLSLLHVK